MAKVVNKIKKIFLPLMFSVMVVGVSSFFVSSLFDEKNTLISSELNQTEHTRYSSKTALGGAWQVNNNSVQTTTVNVIDQNTLSSGFYNFASLPLQNYATDLSNEGFAMFTSSDGIKGNFDQITKFTTRSQLKNFGQNDVITPGNIQWIVKRSDFAKILSVADTSIKLTSMIYSPGGFGAHPSAFVLLDCTTGTNVGSYVFRIMWNAASGPIGSETTPPSPGDYKLFKKVSETSDSYFNFLSLESPSTNTIQVIRPAKIWNLTSEATINFRIISEASSSTPMVTPPANDRFYYAISPQLLASNNISVGAFPRFIWRLNSDIYVFYQDVRSGATNAPYAGTWLKLVPFLGTSPVQLTQKDIIPLDLSSVYNSGVFKDNNVPLVYNLINVASDNYEFLISQGSNAPNQNNSSSHISLSFSLSEMFDNNFVPVIKTHVYPGTNTYFKNITKMYGGVNNASVVAYMALDNLDRVIKLDRNFSNPNVIYNFKQASINLGSIPFIYTKPGDSNWYALMSDGKFAQFLNSNLIGRWDVIASTPSLELAINFNILNSNEINPLILYQNVANDQETDYSTTFTQYLQNVTSYDDFINITFVDPRLAGSLPKISIVASKFIKGPNRTYDVELTFTQQLRTLNPDGSINTGGTPASYTLFTQTYQFINAEGFVYGAEGSTSTAPMPPNSSFSVPAFIKNKFPSEITDAEIRNFLLKQLNVPSFPVSKTFSDLYGTLDISIRVPIMWKNNGFGSYFLQLNEIITINFGTQQLPFFRNEPLFGQNTSITVVDESYVGTDNLLETLTLKYSGTLPSTVSASNIFNDFVILGSAFQNQSLINNGLIILPSENDIILIPSDRDGQILVRITIPKIGNILNKELLFYTPKIFFKNPAANESIYFSFRNNDQVLETTFGTTTKKLSAYSPSEIATLLNGFNNPTLVQTILNYFAIYSQYFNDLISETASTGENLINISAIANDVAGTLDIQIELQSTLPNSNIYRFDKIFSGFLKSGTVSNETPTFSFNNIPTNLLALSPSNITTTQLESANVFLMNSVAVALNPTITLEPINTSGTLGVKIVFNNWVESISGQNVIVPVKEFSRYFSGFPISQDPTSVVIWKSFDEMNEIYKTAFPSFVVNSIKSNQPTNLGQLLEFAHVSESIKSYLAANDSKISLSYIPNDSNGTISIIAKLSGYLSPTNVVIIENKISGFNYIYENNPVTFEVDNSPKVNVLRNRLPTDITDEEAASLYQISYLPNSATLKDVYKYVKNNINGTISIVIELIDPSTNIVKQTNSIIYSGFETVQPPKSVVDYFAVAMAVLIPIILLVPPIIFISHFKNRKEIKRISKLLDKRLTEIEKRETKKIDKE